MRVRALGIALVALGAAAALASFGVWWVRFRYTKGITDAAGIQVQCTQHCGGVDGTYVTGVVIGAAVVLVGLLLILRSLISRRPA